MDYPDTPSHQHAYSPYSSLYVAYGADRESQFNNQEIGDHFLYSHNLGVTQECYCKEKLDVSHP